VKHLARFSNKKKGDIIMSLSTGEMSAADIAAVTGNGFNNGFNGDGWWIILFLILAMGGNWGNGFGNAGGSIPWAINTNNDVERGFDQMATTNGINALQASVTNGFSNVATQLCNGFAGVEQGANARQLADMNQNFALQSSLAECCCENRLGLADLKYTVATEACADRTAVSNALRDVIASNTANTQAILDKMCQQEIEAYKRENDSLRTMVNMQNLAASQTAQTAQLIADNTAQTQYIVNRVAPYPIPSYTVPNPFTPTTGA
jgi:hypothetical protein